MWFSYSIDTLYAKKKKKENHHPTIHQFLTSYLGLCHRWADKPRPPPPQPHPPAHPGKTSPGQPNDIISPSFLGLPRGLFPCQKRSAQESPRRHPNQILNHLNWLLLGGVVALFWVPLEWLNSHPISKAEPSHALFRFHNIIFSGINQRPWSHMWVMTEM